MIFAHNLHARGKENCPPGCGGHANGGECGCKKASTPIDTVKEEKIRSVYESDPDLSRALKGSQYRARIEHLEDLGMVVARRDMRKINGQPRCVECVICRVVLDLGPIELNFGVFNSHFVRFHVPRDVYVREFVDSEDEEDTEGDDESLDDGESDDDGEDEEEVLADDEYETDGGRGGD